jgi:hypothetical protein
VLIGIEASKEDIEERREKEKGILAREVKAQKLIKEFTYKEEASDLEKAKHLR